MGNCLKSSKVMAQNEQPLQLIQTNESPAPARPVAGVKKSVRFKLQQDHNSGEGDVSGNGVVRIKVVVSQKELKRILNDTENSFCTLEQILAELRIKGMETSDADTKDDGYRNNGSWRPVLESIPEELQ